MGNDIPKKLDRYELVERIGQGGMGLIFRGTDTRLKRSVAIKIVSYESKDESFAKSAKERFLNEARAAGALSHANLVQIYDFGESEGHNYLVMEFIEGDTLEHIVQQTGPINSDEVTRLAQQVASGLAYAHRRGIVHRDVKPSNIIVEAQSGIAKIVDFGIAKFIDDKELKMTSTGIVLGSTHYLSPEHVAGKNLDGRSDLFCLGTVLYEISTGVLPFRGSSASTILYKIVNTDPTPPVEIRPGIDPGLSQIIMKLLRKNPQERFQNGEDLINALKEIQNRRSNLQVRKGEDEKPEDRRATSVRPSQLISHLQAQKLLTPKQVTSLRGKAIVPTLLKEAILSEDEIARAISECLSIPWFPRSRLKSLVIQPEALQFLSFDTMEQWNLLPFFFDEKKKSLSILIDGCSDFQRDPALVSLQTDFEAKFYITGRLAIQRLIQLHREKAQQEVVEARTGPSRLSGAQAFRKRILLVDDQVVHHEALIKLFRRNEGGLVIAPSQEEALLKLARDRFDYIWIQRSLIGDELEFESKIQKDYPHAHIRFFDLLGAEIFENSVSYQSYRDLIQRLIASEWQKIPSEAREQEERLLQFVTSLVKTFIEYEKTIDEVSFSFQIYRLSFYLEIDARTLITQFDGHYRFARIFQSLSERYDGRGPNGLKGRQIPLAARFVTALSALDHLKLNPTESFSEEQSKLFKEKFVAFSGKYFDPEIVTAIMDNLKIKEAPQKALKVALIDSDSRFTTELAAELKQLRLDPTIYSDGVSALSGLKVQQPDLIITEILLAKMDGFSLCARVKADEILKNIPLIMLSQSQSSDHATKALSLGADDFISKSQDRSFLLKKIERIIEPARKKTSP